jgi:hypothetical protein
MTLMFCAFGGDARILRVYGAAKAAHTGDHDWQGLLVQTSCGTGVPVMKFIAERGPAELPTFHEEMGEDGVKAYWKRKNSLSIDGKNTGIV